MSAEDFAALGISIDATSVDKGAKSLDDLTESSKRAETATKSLEDASKKASSAQAAYGSQAKTATEASKAMADTIARQNDGMRQTSIAMENQKARLWAIANGYSEVNGQMVKNIAEVDNSTRSMRGNSTAVREALVMIREIARGNWSRLGGSLTIFAGSFGVLGALVTATGLSLIALAATIGIVAYAAIKGAEEQREMQHAIESTGNMAGVTRGQMLQLAETVSTVGGLTVGTAKEMVTQLVASGRLGTDSLNAIAGIANKYAEATGTDTAKLGTELVKLFDDPAKGAEELNKKMHFLSSTQLEYIQTLTKLHETENARLALADAFNNGVPTIVKNIGLIEGAWDKLKDSASRGWDAMMGIGRTQTPEEELSALQKKIEAYSRAKANGQTGNELNDLPMMQARAELLQHDIMMEHEKAEEQSKAAQAQEKHIAFMQDAYADSNTYQLQQNKLMQQATAQELSVTNDVKEKIYLQEHLNELKDKEISLLMKTPEVQGGMNLATLYAKELDAQEEAQKKGLAQATEYSKKLDEIDAARLKKKQAEEKRATDEMQRSADAINNSITEALMRAFESGKGFAMAFRDTVVNMFKTLVLRPIVQYVLQPVSGAMGAFGTGMSSAAQGTQLASTAGSMGAAGANLAWGFNAYNAGATVSGVAEGGSSMATLGAMGAAVAPYAAAAAAAYVVAKYGFGFGNSRENVGGNRLVGDFNRSGFTGNYQQSWKVDGGWFGGGSNGTDITALTSAQSKAYKDTVDTLQHTFNALGDTIGYANVRTQDWTVKINQEGDVTGTLADAMGAQLIPSLVRLQNTGENLAQTAQRVNDAFTSTTSLISGLGLDEASAFGSIGIASADARLALIDAAGGLDKFTTLAGQFSSSILTPAEQLQVSLNAVGSTFARLGVSGVETNQQFADLVKSELALGHYDVVTQLLNVSAAFGQITSSAAALAGQLSTDSFKTMSDYVFAQAQITAQGAGSGSSTIDQAVASATVQLPAIQSSNVAAAKAAALQNMTNLGNVIDPWYQVMDKRTVPWHWANMKVADEVNLGYVSRGGGDSYVDAYFAARDTYNNLPSFASGGMFDGGMRLVGENGPELEVTGPSRIVSNKDLMARLSGGNNDALVAEIRALRAEVARLKSSSDSSASSNKRMFDILDRVTQGGTSIQTTAV